MVKKYSRNRKRTQRVQKRNRTRNQSMVQSRSVRRSVRNRKRNRSRVQRQSVRRSMRNRTRVRKSIRNRPRVRKTRVKRTKILDGAAARPKMGAEEIKQFMAQIQEETRRHNQALSEVIEGLQSKVTELEAQLTELEAPVTVTDDSPHPVSSPSPPGEDSLKDFLDKRKIRPQWLKIFTEGPFNIKTSGELLAMTKEHLRLSLAYKFPKWNVDKTTQELYTAIHTAVD